jgi:hypothetical protein
MRVGGGEQPVVAQVESATHFDGVVESVVREVLSAWRPTFCPDHSMPHEVTRLGRTIGKWRTEIVAWHTARATNGPTEAINNLVKRMKRTAFGFRRFAHYRIRALLYTGAINWTLLNTLTPR